ncbi:MAG: hypothetical protein KJ747_04530 [Actinobacteria bacterium]|nr:hypothetical protein [Actinomycetota bacterium]
MSGAQLRDLSNAIWLCQSCSRIVDANRGDKYPPAVLLGYRDLREFKTSCEMGDVSDLQGWFDEIVVGGAMLSGESSIRLGKATVFRGRNDSGKTMVCDWIAGTQSRERLARWRDSEPPPHLVLRMLHRAGVSELGVAVREGTIVYTLDGASAPLNPLDYRIVYLRSTATSMEETALDRIAHAVGIDYDTAAGLSSVIAQNPGSFVTGARVEGDDLHVGLSGNGDMLPFSRLSGGESWLVTIEFALALAVAEALYRPTLLVIDNAVGSLDRVATERLVARLSTPEFRFQTIVVATDQESPFFGWQLYDFGGTRGTIVPAYENAQISGNGS